MFAFGRSRCPLANKIIQKFTRRGIILFTSNPQSHFTSIGTNQKTFWISANRSYMGLVFTMEGWVFSLYNFFLISIYNIHFSILTTSNKSILSEPTVLGVNMLLVKDQFIQYFKCVFLNAPKPPMVHTCGHQLSLVIWLETRFGYRDTYSKHRSFYFARGPIEDHYLWIGNRRLLHNENHFLRVMRKRTLNASADASRSWAIWAYSCSAFFPAIVVGFPATRVMLFNWRLKRRNCMKWHRCYMAIGWVNCARTALILCQFTDIYRQTQRFGFGAADIIHRKENVIAAFWVFWLCLRLSWGSWMLLENCETFAIGTQSDACDQFNRLGKCNKLHFTSQDVPDGNLLT